MGLGKGTSQVTKKIILRGVELLAIVMLCAGAMGAQEPADSGAGPVCFAELAFDPFFPENRPIPDTHSVVAM